MKHKQLDSEHTIIIRLQNLVTTNYRICTSGKIISSKATTKSQLKKRFNHSNPFTFTTYKIYMCIIFLYLLPCIILSSSIIVIQLLAMYWYWFGKNICIYIPKESLFCFCCNCLCYKVLPCCRWTI